MKRILKGIGILSVMLATVATQAQEVLINEGGGTPDGSAMLEVQSTSKGMLVPRMTTTQMNAISSPATGLLIFNTTSGSFFFYNGSNWVDLSEDNLGDHKATQSIELNSNYISNDGDNEGISVANNGQVTVTPATTGAGNVAEFVNGDIRTVGLGTGVYFTNTNIGITGNNSNSGDMRFKTAGTDRLTIQAGGGSIFSGAISGSSTLTMTGNATFNNDVYLSGSDDYLGIGTSSPTNQLTIFGDSSTAFSLKSTDNSKDHGLAFENSGGAFTWTMRREDVGSNAADLVIAGGDQDTDINNLTERLRINKRGDVGIGTNNPSSILHVNEAPPTDANDGQILISESTSSNTMVLGRTQTYGYVQTHNSEALSINPLGNNVGIGTTGPNVNLHVNSSSSQSWLQFTNSSTGTTSSDGLRLGITGTTSYIQGFENGDLRLRTNNTDRITVDANGEVGIGTLTPSRLFHVHNASATNSYQQMTHSSSGSSSTDGLLVGQSGNNSFIYNYENGYMAFRTNNTERIRIESGGDVGIGLTNPTAKLHVNGTSNLAGNTTVTGKTTTTTLKVTSGASSNKVLVSDADGDASWSDIPAQTHTDMMSASEWSDDVLQSGTTFGTYGWNYRYVEFENNKNEDLALMWFIPADLSNNTVTMRVFYTGNVAGNNFRVFTAWKSLGDGEGSLGNNPGGNTATWAGPTAADDLKVFSRTFNTNGKELQFIIFRRLGSDGSDTNTGNLRILGVAFDYQN